MCGIAWCTLSWEAFATLVTGALAVAGAIFIGIRQLDIARRQATIVEGQTEILERQVRLGELTLRSELFERRSEVYAAAEAFLTAIVREARFPERDEEIAFVKAMSKARFLFPPQVEADLRETWRHALAMRAARRLMDREFQVGQRYSQENIDREDGELNWLADRFQTLSDLFGDELRLA